MCRNVARGNDRQSAQRRMARSLPDTRSAFGAGNRADAAVIEAESRLKCRPINPLYSPVE
jgi:hypothetical protein